VINERIEPVQNLGRFDAVAGAHCLGRIECPAANEDGEPPEQASLGLI
jgi:hypothetical protein